MLRLALAALAATLAAAAPAQAATVVRDTFTGLDGQTLAGQHVGETGADWTLGNGSDAEISSNRTRRGSASGFVYASGVPADNSQTAVGRFYLRSKGLGIRSVTSLGLRALPNGSSSYRAEVFSWDGHVGVKVAKVVNGTASTIGAQYTWSQATGTSFDVAFSVSGTTLKLKVNGTEVRSLSDSAISQTGRAGVFFYGEGTAAPNALELDGLTVADGSTPPAAAQCADGADNDRDGKVDYPSDAGCSSSADNDETDAPPPSTGGSGVPGAVVDLSWGISQADADRTYRELSTAGSKAIRVGFGWRSLETSPGVYNSTKLAVYDGIVQRARSAGQRVLFDVIDTPGWANGGKGANVPPTDPESIRPFLRDMAVRYGPMGVEAFEIWNEQDLARFWSPPNPAKYAALLRVAYSAIKGAYPQLKVVTGGTSGNDHNYWRAAYAAGIAGKFDVMAVHPYTGTGNPDAAWYDSNGRIDEWAFVGYREVHNLMLANGDGDKPIWFTEFGWSSATDGGWASVGPTNQAQYLTDAFRLLRQDRYVGIAFWYSFRDGDWTIDADFGLFKLGWTPKPALGAYKTAAGVQ